jgi:hypothetical protein
MKEEAPFALELEITQEGSHAFELRGQSIIGTRVVWRTQGDIRGVQLKHLVHFGICYIGQEELLQVSAKLRIVPSGT